MAAVCAKCFRSGKGSEVLVRPAEGLKGKGNALTQRRACQSCKGTEGQREWFDPKVRELREGR